MTEQQTTPELRFSEFKEEWKLENLGNLADIVRGASPRPIKILNGLMIIATLVGCEFQMLLNKMEKLNFTTTFI